MILGISGFARAGKDTAALYLRKSLQAKGFRSTTFSFADELKRMADPFCVKHFGISAFATSTEEKKIIRPFLVGMGETCRNLHPDFWIAKVEPNVKACIEKLNILPVVTDVRYANEGNWVKRMGGIIIYISRDGVGPANSEEARTVPEVEAMADLRIDWPTFGVEELEKCQSFADEILSKLPLDKLGPYAVQSLA